MNLSDLEREIESINRRIKMKREVSAESSEIDQKKILYRQIRELEQELFILEKRKGKLTKTPVMIKIPTRKLILKPGRE